MAKGVNKVFLLGYLGQDPDVKNTQGGAVVATLSVATNSNVKDGDNWVEKVEWHRVVVFGKMAEVCRDYLQKGSQVYIEGRLQTRKWQDQQGQDRWTTEIIAHELQMVGGKGNGNGNGNGNGDNRGQPPVATPPQTYQQRPPAQPPQYERPQLPPPQAQQSYQQAPVQQSVSHQGQGRGFDDDIPF